MAFWAWLLMGLLRGIGSKKKDVITLLPATLQKTKKEYRTNDFFELFEKDQRPGLLTIQTEGTTVLCWHVPILNNLFWKKGLLLDGSAAQLPTFLAVPLSGAYDVVFVDGRARVPCIKRAHYDNLIKKGGYLFVHDAFRAEMSEGFKLFRGTKSFVHGSNKTFNGTVRCHSDFGLPLAFAGDSLQDRNMQIVRELFVYEHV